MMALSELLTNVDLDFGAENNTQVHESYIKALEAYAEKTKELGLENLNKEANQLLDEAKLRYEPYKKEYEESKKELEEKNKMRFLPFDKRNREPVQI